jgi:hypothetical protein
VTHLTALGTGDSYRPLSLQPEEISKMIVILKISAVVLCASLLYELFSRDFGPGFVLAVVGLLVLVGLH